MTIPVQYVQCMYVCMFVFILSQITQYLHTIYTHRIFKKQTIILIYVCCIYIYIYIDIYNYIHILVIYIYILIYII